MAHAAHDFPHSRGGDLLDAVERPRIAQELRQPPQDGDERLVEAGTGILEDCFGRRAKRTEPIRGEPVSQPLTRRTHAPFSGSADVEASRSPEVGQRVAEWPGEALRARVRPQALHVQFTGRGNVVDVE
jgi:hypothetical protein